MKSGTIIISSYLPTYRTPPPLVDCIDWENCDLLNFGRRAHGSGIIIDKSASYTVSDGSGRSITGFYIAAIARRYIMAHPEVLSCDEKIFKLGWARSMLCQMALEARRRGKVDIAIGSGLVEAVHEADELLDFEYVSCSLTINVAPMLDAVRKNHHLLKEHIAKRASDKRYKYMHDRRLRNFKYWLNPENWIGFSAGFLVDYYIYQVLPGSYRQAMWRLPQSNVAADSGSVADYISINENFSKVFQDPELVTFLAKQYIPVMPVYCSSWTIMHTPLDPTIDALITEMAANPDAFKQHIIERRLQRELAEATKRSQGAVLQTTDATPGQHLSYIENGRANYVITDRSPEPGNTREVPVYGADGAIVGRRRVADDGSGSGVGSGGGQEPTVTRQVQPNDARRELERLLAELRT